MNEGKKDRRDPIRTVKPRNFVAKNAGATTSGAGAHKDKKKAAKQGYEKHKKTYAESLEQKLSEAFDFCPVCGCSPCNCTSIFEASPMGKMGFPDEFISAIYKGSNLQHSEQPVPLQGKPKAADFKDGVVIAKGRDGKMYAVRWADKNYGGRDGAILYTWDHENGATGGKYVTFTQALAPMKAGTEFWKIPLQGYDRGRGNTQVDRARGNTEQLQWETLEYMNKTFLPQLKGRIEQYLDYIYANLRKLKTNKQWVYDKTEQEQALSAAKALQDIADKGFNKETVTQFLYANKMGDSGWGSYYRNQENFVELMNTKPAARAEFAKMVFNSAKSLYQSVKDMVQAPVTNALKGKAVAEGGEWDEYTGGDPFPDSNDDYEPYGGEHDVDESEYDPSYDPEYRGYQKPERNVDWDIEADRNRPDEPVSTTTVIIYDANRKEVLRFPSTGGYYGDIRYATSKGFNPESDNYDVKWQKDVSEDQGMTDIAAWKQAVLKAYPRYAGHIKFKGRGTQISAEVPGMDRSFGVFDLSTGHGEVLDEGKIYLEKLTNALAEAVKKI